MQTKKGAGGLQQPYISAGNGDKSGEYTSFDSSCLDSRIAKLSKIIGYDKVIQHAYNQFEPPLTESKHLKQRLEERGITRVLIAEALLKPMEKSEIKYDRKGRPSIAYYGTNVTVYINPKSGKITSVHKTRRNIRNKYRR